MNIRVVVFVKVFNGFNHLPWFLGGCSIVEVYKRVIVDFAFEYGKVLSNQSWI
jgi:hypothetical protein